MKYKLIFCLALVLGGFGCRTGGGHSTAGQQQAVVANGLQMSLAVLKTDKSDDPGFEVTFRNVGTNDICLNLGNMLANGRVQLPAQIHLTLRDESGKVRELDFGDKRYGAIGGRMDDYVVPLRSGSSYTVDLRLDQFWSPGTKEFEVKLKPGRYRVSAWFQEDDGRMDKLNLLLETFWQGRLESNVCSYIE